MADIQLIEEGKYKIQTVGPVASGVGKASGKPWRTVDIQFEGDGTWYSLFWPQDKKDLPQVGQELEGKKEFNKDFNKHQFNTGFGGNKANWNPAGANAQVFLAASAIVQGFLTLKAEHLEKWEAERKKGQTAIEQYLETVAAVAGNVKQRVVKMGGETPAAGTATAAQASTPPPSDGDPGPVAPGVETWTEEDEPVDLGGL